MKRLLTILAVVWTVVGRGRAGPGRETRRSPPRRAAASATQPNQFDLSSAGRSAPALVIIGAGMGIGRIGAAAVDSMARQPEVAGNIQGAMIIAAALIEGVTFFALIVCMLYP